MRINIRALVKGMLGPNYKWQLGLHCALLKKEISYRKSFQKNWLLKKMMQVKKPKKKN